MLFKMPRPWKIKKEWGTIKHQGRPCRPDKEMQPSNHKHRAVRGVLERQPGRESPTSCTKTPALSINCPGALLTVSVELCSMNVVLCGLFSSPTLLMDSFMLRLTIYFFSLVYYYSIIQICHNVSILMLQIGDTVKSLQLSKTIINSVMTTQIFLCLWCIYTWNAITDTAKPFPKWLHQFTLPVV